MSLTRRLSISDKDSVFYFIFIPAKFTTHTHLHVRTRALRHARTHTRTQTHTCLITHNVVSLFVHSFVRLLEVLRHVARNVLERDVGRRKECVLLRSQFAELSHHRQVPHELRQLQRRNNCNSY